MQNRKDIPMLFTGEMVRKILSGEKIRTRRIVKEKTVLKWLEEGYTSSFICNHENTSIRKYSIGDIIWVREKWAPFYYTDDSTSVVYAADCYDDKSKASYNRQLINVATDKDKRKLISGSLYSIGKWYPSIFMPRLISRISLEIIDLHIERLHDITEEEAREEGITDGGCLSCGEHEPCGCDNPNPDARDSFIYLWNSINEKRGYGWDINPWVRNIKFKKI